MCPGMSTDSCCRRVRPRVCALGMPQCVDLRSTRVRCDTRLVLVAAFVALLCMWPEVRAAGSASKVLQPSELHTQMLRHGEVYRRLAVLASPPPAQIRAEPSAQTQQRVILPIPECEEHARVCGSIRPRTVGDATDAIANQFCTHSQSCCVALSVAPGQYADEAHVVVDMVGYTEHGDPVRAFSARYTVVSPEDYGLGSPAAMETDPAHPLCETCTAISAALGVQAPSWGSLLAGDAVEVHLHRSGPGDSKGSHADARGAQQQRHRISVAGYDDAWSVPSQQDVAHLHGLDPGTLVLTAEQDPLHPGDATAVKGGCVFPGVAYAELVPDAPQLERMRELQEYAVRAPTEVGRSTPDPGSSDRGASRESRVHLCFDTALTRDGQRTLLFQQLEGLPAEEFQLTVISASSGGSLTSKVDGEEQDESALSIERALYANPNITYHRRFPPQLVAAELVEYFGHTPGEQELVQELQSAYTEAQGNIDQLPSDWLKRTWRSLIDNLNECANADAYIYTSSGLLNDAIMSMAARHVGIQNIVIELANLRPVSPGVGPWTTFVAPSAFALHHASVKGVIDRTGASGRVISPGVDSAGLFRPREQPREARLPHRVAYVGRLAHDKSVGLFLQMAKKVTIVRPDVEFVVVGDGPLRPHLQAMLSMLDMPSHKVRFVGWVSRDALPGVLREVDLVVHPSVRETSETFCIANAEAMAAGVPVLSFGVGGTWDYFHRLAELVPRDLFLFNQTKPSHMAQRVLYLLSNPAERERLAKAAREVIQEHFTPETMLQSYRALYSTFTSSEHGRQASYQQGGDERLNVPLDGHMAVRTS